MSISSKKIKILVFLLVSQFLAFHFASAAILPRAGFSIESTDKYYFTGQTFSINIIMDTADQAVNAVGIDLLFPADNLEVVSSSLNQSSLGFIVAKPTYSNIEGKINLNGIIPNPGVNSRRVSVATVVFRVRAAGQAKLNFATSSLILLNDGLGTNIFTSSTGTTFTLKNKYVPEPPVATSKYLAVVSSFVEYSAKSFAFLAIVFLIIIGGYLSYRFYRNRKDKLNSR